MTIKNDRGEFTMVIGMVTQEVLDREEKTKLSFFSDLKEHPEKYQEVKCKGCSKSGWSLVSTILKFMNQYPTEEIVFNCANCAQVRTGGSESFMQLDLMGLNDLQELIDKEGEGILRAFAASLLTDNLEITDDVPEDHPILKDALTRVIEVIETDVLQPMPGSTNAHEMFKASFLMMLRADLDREKYKSGCNGVLRLGYRIRALSQQG